MTSSDAQGIEALKQALATASPDSLKVTQTDEEKKNTSLFLLKGHAYYDLQNYLNIGTQVQPDVEHFKNAYPVASLGDLVGPTNTIKEPSIYNKLMNATTDIFAHCHAFQMNHMGQFVTKTASILNYCDDFSRYVGGAGLLRDQFKVLANPSSTDSAIHIARVKSGFICKVLADRAATQQKESDDLVTALEGFRQETLADKVHVDYLVAQFMGPGPYVPASDIDTNWAFVTDASGRPVQRKDAQGKLMDPYRKMLQSKLYDLQIQAQKERDLANKDWDEWKHDTIVAATAVTYMWFFPFGTIAGAATMATFTAKAIEAKEKYEAEAALADQEEKDARALTGCLELVTQLSSQFSNLERVIGQAIEAMTQMRNMFAEQGRCFKSAKDYIGTVDLELKDDMVEIRQMAESDMAVAISAWAEIKVLALDFMTNAHVQYVQT